MTAILALLRLVPLKDWLYGSAIVALLIGFALFVRHEREVGRQQQQAAIAKTIADQRRQTEKAITYANAQISASESIARSARSAPIIDSPHVVIRMPDNAAQGACPVSAAPATTGGNDAGAPDAAGHTIDIGPPLDRVGRDADVEIEYLQSYIRACQQAGYCK